MMMGLNEEGELISEGKCVIISNFAVAEPSGAWLTDAGGSGLVISYNLEVEGDLKNGWVPENLLLKVVRCS